MTECFSCYVATKPKSVEAVACVLWGAYHWPLCARHVKAALKRFSGSREVPVSACPLCNGTKAASGAHVFGKQESKRISERIAQKRDAVKDATRQEGT